ncbi:MAG: hypothetical protein K9N06_04580 [Candidatus Cloacimonetes bacterium]|nr:hypothetical protein [Candidatus Cloacimonadota bacterium]
MTLRKRSVIVLFLLSLIIPAILPAVTVFDIQYTNDAQGNSPYLGQTVTVSGIVTASGYYSGANYNRFFLSDPAGGAWHGIFCYNSDYEVSAGDLVELTAQVEEYYGFTELNNVSSLQIISSGNSIPEPATVTTQEAASEEAYEGCLVKVEIVDVTAVTNNYGEWYVNDGSGACQIDDAIFSFGEVTIGTHFNSITGVVDYSYDEYGINPRNAGDFVLTGMPFIEEITIEPESPVIGEDVTVKALIRDYDGFITYASITWREVTGTAGAWQTNSLLPISDDYYEFELPGLELGAFYYEYSITARDNDDYEVMSSALVIEFLEPAIDLVNISLANMPLAGDSLLLEVILEYPLHAYIQAWLIYTIDFHSEEFLAELKQDSLDSSLFQGEIPGQKEGATLYIGVYAYNDFMDIYFYDQISYTFPVKSHQAILKVPPHPFNPAKEVIGIEYYAQTGDRALMRIYNAEGKLMITPENRIITSANGINRYNWDGRNAAGEVLPWGLYICHLEVQEQNSGELKAAKVPIVIGAPLQ